MYAPGAYPMAFQYPGQPAVAPVYQSQYGAFNPQGGGPFQQVQPSRGQSLPAPIRQQYPPQNGSAYAPTQSRRNGQYPPPAPSQNYDQQHREGKSKKHNKRRSVSPNGVADQGLYSDKEKANPKAADGQNRGQSPAVGTTRSKQEDTHPNDQDQTSQAIENTNDETSLGGTAPLEDQQEVKEKRKSRSKKKRHHRHEQHEQYNNYYQQQQQQPQQQQSAFYGGLPEHMRVHQQPLYNGYNQAYEESVRRDDAYHKQAKHSTRLPPEAKQQLLPHENDQQPPQQQQQQLPQQPYPYPGYPEQQYPAVPQPFNPYQPYGPSQQPFFVQPPTYNSLQPWSPAGVVSNPADQEIYRLRTHILSLEGELHKLQKKLTKATINQKDISGGQEESTRSHRRSKREGATSPRQTPVIVELNNTNGENAQDSSSKKNRHRTPSNVSSQQGQSSAAVPSDNVTRSDAVNAPAASSNGPNPNQQLADPNERARVAGNLNVEPDNRNGNKNPREEAAAQLAHAAAAHVNARQQGPPPPPPTVQQQYLYQPGVLPPQVQQVRGPAPPRQPGPGPVRYPNDPYQQQLQQQQQPQQQQLHQQQQQRNVPNPNYNQSNNNELYSNDEEQQRTRSAEKILDAFERFYMTSGKTSTAPMKVKFIPDEQVQNHHQTHHPGQRNKNNNNRYRSTSRSSQSSSLSTRSGSDRSSSRNLNPKAACSYDI